MGGDGGASGYGGAVEGATEGGREEGVEIGCSCLKELRPGVGVSELRNLQVVHRYVRP